MKNGGRAGTSTAVIENSAMISNGAVKNVVQEERSIGLLHYET